MWTLQSQFAAYVLAREHGVPELELLERTPAASPIGELLAGRAELGLVSPLHLLAAGPTASELVIVALFQARSPVRMAGLRERVGERIQAREGLRVGVWPGEYTELQAILRRAGVGQVEFVSVQDETEALLSGDVDYVQCTTYNELPAIEAAAGGADAVVAHDPATWGVDAPKDGIAVRADLLAHTPELVDRFLAAALAGWVAARSDPAAAAAAVCSVVPALDADGQRLQRERVLALIEHAHALGEPRASDVERALHAARAAGNDDARGDAVRIDRRAWERARG
jgi:ABC-type nitrate/sulfonate/bicarbonate transport system substrate-binding protein